MERSKQIFVLLRDLIIQNGGAAEIIEDSVLIGGYYNSEVIVFLKASEGPEGLTVKEYLFDPNESKIIPKPARGLLSRLTKPKRKFKLPNVLCEQLLLD